MANPEQIVAELQQVLDLRKLPLTRAKTVEAAALRAELAYVLCVTHHFTFDSAAQVLKVHPRSINRYIEQHLQRNNAGKEIEKRRGEKTELNRFFGLMERPAQLIELRVSDSEYLDLVIKSLTQTQRRTLYEFFYKWKSTEAIADEEGVSQAAIRRRIERIKDLSLIHI